MSELERFYAGQTSAEWYRAEQASLRQEAAERGMTLYQLQGERQAAAAESRLAESRRVAELVSDPVLLRALRAYWAPVPLGQQRPPNPLEAPAPPTPTPDTNRPPSAGRIVSGGDGRTVWGAGSRADTGGNWQHR